MNDSISRKQAIKAIDDLPNCYNGFSDTYDKAYIIGVLEELPSAQPKTCAYWDRESNLCALYRPSAQPEQRWIPVSERLPDNDDEVLVTVEFKKRRFVYSGSCSKDVDGDPHWCSLWDEFRISSAKEKIVAWMPMPKPYKG